MKWAETSTATLVATSSLVHPRIAEEPLRGADTMSRRTATQAEPSRSRDLVAEPPHNPKVAGSDPAVENSDSEGKGYVSGLSVASHFSTSSISFVHIGCPKPKRFRQYLCMSSNPSA